MKRIFFFIVSSLVLSSCMKQDTGCKPLTPKSEEAQILKFAESQNLTVQKDPSGIYYQIIEPGSGPAADLTSKIFITYKGQFLDGTTFDQQTDPTKTGWTLGPSSEGPGLIEGWQIGIPLIKKGGHIKMIIPSSLAYGCTGRSSIRPNEILFFDVTLTDIQ